MSSMETLNGKLTREFIANLAILRACVDVIRRTQTTNVELTKHFNAVAQHFPDNDKSIDLTSLDTQARTTESKLSEISTHYTSLSQEFETREAGLKQKLEELEKKRGAVKQLKRQLEDLETKIPLQPVFKSRVKGLSRSSSLTDLLAQNQEAVQNVSSSLDLSPQQHFVAFQKTCKDIAKHRVLPWLKKMEGESKTWTISRSTQLVILSAVFVLLHWLVLTRVFGFGATANGYASSSGGYRYVSSSFSNSNPV